MTREEAIEVYNGLINEKIKAAFEFFAPELAESDDERIIKTLQEYVKNRNWNLNGPSQAEVLAWLEKQKETVSTENQAAEVGDDETEVQKAYREGKIAGRQEVIDHPDYYQLIKPEEQDSEEVFNKIDNSFRKGREVGFREGVESVKSAEWSEEDENFFKTALWHISYSISNGKRTDEHCDTTDWLKGVKERLKALRPRPSWKPSEEHIDAIETAINELQSTRPYRSEIIYLKSILEHIKNL